MDDDAFIECPVCKGEGVDLDGYVVGSAMGMAKLEMRILQDVELI